MKLCVLQGTFDPIHNAHTDMAKYALNKYNFDKVLFIPAYDPPHKDSVMTPAQDRFEMVKLATMDNDRFEVSDIEYKRKGKSYTYLTLCELYKIFPIDDKINFIIGTDAFEKIDSWYNFEKLKNLVRFLIFKRTSQDFKYDGKADYTIEDMDFENISSTEIRERVKNGKNIDKMVNDRVKDYIEKNELYRD